MIAADLPAPQRRAMERGLPYRVHVILTHTCNLACAHCYQAEHRSEDLSLSELSTLFSDLANLGVTFLVLGGGEPLARKDFWEIVAEAKRQRFAIELYTNAMLVDESAAKKLKDAGVVRATVSLHGGHALTHDVFVRRPGSYERIQKGIDHLERAGVPVMVRSNATSLNYREIPLLELKYRGRPLVTYGGAAPHLYAKDDGDQGPVLYRMTEEQERTDVRRRIGLFSKEKVASELARLAASHRIPEGENVPCQAARTYFTVQPNGDVTPCTQTGGHPMGNVRQRPLAEIWRDSPAAKRFRGITLEAFSAGSDKCASCEFRHVCSRCPALSEQHSGSLTGWNPQTCQTTTVYWTELLRRADELGLSREAAA